MADDEVEAPAGEGDAIFELLGTIPMLNLMAVYPYFPPSSMK